MTSIAFTQKLLERLGASAGKLFDRLGDRVIAARAGLSQKPPELREMLDRMRDQSCSERSTAPVFVRDRLVAHAAAEDPVGVGASADD